MSKVYLSNKNYLRNSLNGLEQVAKRLEGIVLQQFTEAMSFVIKDAEAFIDSADKEKKNLEEQVSDLQDQADDLKIELDKIDALEVLRLKRVIVDLNEQITQLQYKLEDK